MFRAICIRDVDRKKGSLMERIGVGLRTIRRELKLTLREVEERSLLIAEKWGDQSYQISASWLHRLECEEHVLAINKLFVLARIYRLPPDKLLLSMHPENIEPTSFETLSSPNATILLSQGPLEEQAKYLLPDTRLDQPPDGTALCPAETGPVSTRYRQGIIGKLDHTLDPMIPPGSLVQIDTQKHAISSRKDWKNEFQRPIYFLMNRDGYVCGWCELDAKLEWLTLVPHPLSPVSNRRWRYRKEIEPIGRVAAVSMRLIP
jgi:transcriptional regulator with XRE-family HTH domain